MRNNCLYLVVVGYTVKSTETINYSNVEVMESFRYRNIMMAKTKHYNNIQWLLSAVILKEQLLLSINLGRIIRPF